MDIRLKTGNNSPHGFRIYCESIKKKRKAQLLPYGGGPDGDFGEAMAERRKDKHAPRTVPGSMMTGPKQPVFR
jgi:hypothetical protein